jgi:WD40 repeat protein
MIFSGDDSKLICLGDGIYCWNVNTGALIYSTNTNVQYTSASGVDLSPDGQTIAFATGSQVRLLNSSTGSIIYTFPTFADGVGPLKYSANNLLAVFSGENRIDIWDGSNNSLKSTITGFPTGTYSFFFTDDNIFIISFIIQNASFSGNGTPYDVWRLSDSRLVGTLQGGIPIIAFPIRGQNIICSDFEFWGIYDRPISNQWGLLNY